MIDNVCYGRLLAFILLLWLSYIIIIIIIKQENDYSDVRQLIAVARALQN